MLNDAVQDKKILETFVEPTIDTSRRYSETTLLKYFLDVSNQHVTKLIDTEMRLWHYHSPVTQTSPSCSLPNFTA